ncbi:hypothetical protein RB595_005551 [Gaeumannomyces hyphopodioides]
MPADPRRGAAARRRPGSDAARGKGAARLCPELRGPPAAALHDLRRRRRLLRLLRAGRLGRGRLATDGRTGGAVGCFQESAGSRGLEERQRRPAHWRLRRLGERRGCRRDLALLPGLGDVGQLGEVRRIRGRPARRLHRPRRGKGRAGRCLRPGHGRPRVSALSDGHNKRVRPRDGRLGSEAVPRLRVVLDARRRLPPPYDVLYQHKTAVYRTSFAVQNETWSPPATVHPANFAADLVAVAVGGDDDDDDRLAFFGLGVNGQVWTSNWTSPAGWGNARSIGGFGFQSVPVVINTGSTIEVVALGSDDRLKHRSLKGGQWSDAPGEAGGWEDLAVQGHSAPQAVYIGGPDRLVALMVVGRGRQLNLTVFSIPDDGVWSRRAVWRSAGGNFSTSFMDARGAD